MSESPVCAIPLASLPSDATFRRDSQIYMQSAQLVLVFDEIRFELDHRLDAADYAEFFWFAREYPRCYRHHVSAAAYHLRHVYAGYRTAHACLTEALERQSAEDFISLAYENSTTHEIYWEFEAFLTHISSALDLLARIVGTAYRDHLPPTFNKLCKRTELPGPVRRLRIAQRKWVSTMKRYRDCFVHYTPADTSLAAVTYFWRGEFHVWCSIPRNPEARDITRFRSSKRMDVLRYAIYIWNEMLVLDRLVAADIARLYRAKAFPWKREGLFRIGQSADKRADRNAVAGDAKVS